MLQTGKAAGSIGNYARAGEVDTAVSSGSPIRAGVQGAHMTVEAAYPLPSDPQRHRDSRQRRRCLGR
jgi:hypothetical protein